MTTQSQTRRLPAQSTGFKGFFTALCRAHAAWRQRRALERLDDSALTDIGLSRTEAHIESRRPVWDVPAHWLH